MEKEAPYKSEAQRRFFHANKARLEAQGVDVGEWDRATKGKKLPEKVKSAEWSAFADELEKISIDPLSIGAIGAASHIGSNVATKLLHKPLSKFRAGMMSKGIRESLSGKPRGTLSKAVELWAGPEHTLAESQGRYLGGHLRQIPTGKRYRVLKKLRKEMAMTPQLRHTPMLEDVVGGINRALEKPLPAAAPIKKPGAASSILAAAPAPLLAATEPGALMHAGVNVLRKRVALSEPGQRFMQKSFLKGMGDAPAIRQKMLEWGLPSPTRLGKLKELATDVLVSPAALNTRRIGRDLAALAASPEGTARIQKLHGAISPLIRARQRSNAEALERVKEFFAKL